MNDTVEIDMAKAVALRQALEANPEAMAAFRDALPELAASLLDGELSDDNLDGIAGGQRNHFYWCLNSNTGDIG